MKDFRVDVGELLSVAAAVLGPDGVLLQANPGFLRLLPAGLPHPIGRKVSRFFIQPTFGLLNRGLGEDSEGYRGMLTIGDFSGKTRTLRGKAWKTGGQLRVLAEYDVEELEQVTDAIVDLNEHSALVEHSLALDNLSLKRQEKVHTEALLTDPLTGVGNRRRMDQALDIEIARVRRGGSSRLSAIMADVDHFKRINDDYGHAAGDKVLVELGRLLRAQTRDTDVVARFGGEEFVVLMPDAALADAVAKAEQLRLVLGAQPIPPLPAPVTASFGVAELRPGEGGESLLERIDEALYQAKEGGRNRVVHG